MAMCKTQEMYQTYSKHCLEAIKWASMGGCSATGRGGGGGKRETERERERERRELEGEWEREKQRERERERKKERKRERRRQNAQDRGTNKHRAPGQQTHSPGPRLTTPTATHSHARTSAPFADNTTDKDTQTAAGGEKREIETEASGMAQRGLGFRCCRGRRVLLVLELLCKLVTVHSNVVLGILRIESRVWRAAVCAPRSLSLGPSLSLAHLLSLLLSWLPSSATLPGCRGQCDPFPRWERP